MELPRNQRDYLQYPSDQPTPSPDTKVITTSNFGKNEIIERNEVATGFFFLHYFEYIGNFLKDFVESIKNFTLIEHIDCIMLALILIRGLEIIILIIKYFL